MNNFFVPVRCQKSLSCKAQRRRHFSYNYPKFASYEKTGIENIEVRLNIGQKSALHFFFILVTK